jgi:hypothetical protein
MNLKINECERKREREGEGLKWTELSKNRVHRDTSLNRSPDHPLAY